MPAWLPELLHLRDVARELEVSLKELLEMHPAWQQMGSTLLRARRYAARHKAEASAAGED